MKVRFDATLEDFVDVGLRSSGPRRQVYMVGIAAGLIIGGLIANVAYAIMNSRLLFGIGFAAGFIIFFVTLVRLPKRNLIIFYRKRIGITGPVPYEVEICEAGLTCNGLGMMVISAWKIIENIEETDDAIYFRNKFGLYAAVRKRGFANEEEMKEFLDLAKHYWSEAAVPRPPNFENSNQS
jgi:MFS family permease